MKGWSTDLVVLHLNLSQIVLEARRLAEDSAVDGFGHHNPHVGIEDDLWYSALAVDRLVDGLFGGRALSVNEREFVHLLCLGIHDGREGYDLPITAATRAMRHTSALMMRVWMMFKEDHQKVGLRLG